MKISSRGEKVRMGMAGAVAGVVVLGAAAPAGAPPIAATACWQEADSEALCC